MIAQVLVYLLVASAHLVPVLVAGCGVERRERQARMTGRLR